MGEAKLREDEIAQVKAQAMARQQAQAMHARLMETPAVFAPSFYLADAAGLVRLIMHEPGADGGPVVRGSFITTTEAILKLAEIAPQFVARMHEAQAEAKKAGNGGAPPEAKIEQVDAPDAMIGTALPTDPPVKPN